MDKLRLIIADLQTRFQALTARERRLVTAAAVTLGLFLTFIVYFSFASSAAGYHRRIESKGIKLKEAQALAGSYQQAEQTRRDMERQLSVNQVQLISYLEEKGAAAGLD